MTRLALAGLALLVLPAPAVRAQAPTDISKQIIGTWEGPYQSEAVPPGSLRLVIARDASKAWKVTMEVIADDPPAAGEVKEFTVDGNTLSWSQDIGDMLCHSTVKLVAGVMKGEAECTQGGAVALTATFLLVKKA